MTGDDRRAFDPRALSRAYDVPAVRQQRMRTRQLLDVAPGGTVLDLSCGPGHLAVELRQDHRVVAADRDAAMLDTTQARVQQAGRPCLLVQAEATALPLTDGSCDGATVVQLLEYVPQVERALRELHRVLRPGGRAVLVDTDWRSCVWQTDDRERTDVVLRQWEAHFAHPHLPSVLPGLARAAGFVDVAVHSLPIVETDTAQDTYSVGMAGTIARFVGQTEPALADEWRADLRRQAADGTWFFSLTRFATVVARPLSRRACG